MSSDSGIPIKYTVTWLEMTSAPDRLARPVIPPDIQLLEAENPPVWYFLALYDVVGRDYDWTDQFEVGEAQVESFLKHPGLTMHTMIRNGWPQGFFVLDPRDGICDIAYLGLVKEAIGLGLGKWLLDMAVAIGWRKPSARCLTVNTCTLDHPRALDLYRSAGFTAIRTEKRLRYRKEVN